MNRAVGRGTKVIFDWPKGLQSATKDDVLELEKLKWEMTVAKQQYELRKQMMQDREAQFAADIERFIGKVKSDTEVTEDTDDFKAMFK